MEKGVIIGVFRKNETDLHIDRRLDEMQRLCTTAGIEVLESFAQRTDTLSPSHFAGRGKLEQIGITAEELGADVLITANPLSPVQHRNIEDMLGMKVIDRNELILDIFAGNARTNVSKIEAELAQYRYILPRLTGKGVMMSRTGGGIGTRGPGEKKLEIDRRRITDRIRLLKSRLQKYKKDSIEQRKKRKGVFTVSLVGYTNAGKTTIMNALTSKKLDTQDKLFTTLDTTTRKMGRDIVLTDTIGFLGELPHELIQSFDLTLKEAAEADLKLIVADISDRYVEENIYDVGKVLESLGFMDGAYVHVFNKIDTLVDIARIDYYRNLYPESVFVSAHTGENMAELKDKIHQMHLSTMHHIHELISHDESELMNFILSRGYVINQAERDNGTEMEFCFTDRDFHIYRNMRKDVKCR